MRLALAVLIFLVGGCDGPGANNAALTGEQIERLSTPKTIVEDPAAAVRLQPLAGEDLVGQGLEEGCRFTRNGQLLVAASGNNAVARIGGAFRHFVPSSPVDETGGFFEDRQISVSIGRRDSAEGGGRLVVTNRRTQFQQEWLGEWSCAR